MGKRTVEEASLVAVADAIRERAGTTEAMEFPNGFVNAVEGIPDYLEMLITGTLNSYENSKVTAIAKHSFSSKSYPISCSFPNVITVWEYVFYWSGITEIDLPKCEQLSYECFYGAVNLKTIRLPSMKRILGRAFEQSGITALILPCENGIPTVESNSLVNTPIANGTGYIYVPSRYVDTVKAATNWSALASQVRAIEDYPDITGG